jgi:hypothetical protein
LEHLLLESDPSLNVQGVEVCDAMAGWPFSWGDLRQ